MMIFSTGQRDTSVFLPVTVAYTRVSPPTLPMNMSKIRTICETVLSAGVIPRDRPTVPIADALSNRHVLIGRLSVMLIMKDPDKARKAYIRRSVDAVLIVLSSTRLPRICTFFRLRNTAKVLAIRTVMVVVFIPPAVEPGEPPINIRMIRSMRPAPLKDVRSDVLKPAVLGVTDWNRERHILSFKVNPEYSNKNR